MRFPFESLAATFVDRPNRFLVLAQLRGTGEIVRAHCADPGRLRELLVPGGLIYVSESARRESSTTHDLRFAVHPQAGTLVSMDSRLSNRLFGEALSIGLFDRFRGYSQAHCEVQLPCSFGGPVRSRLDYRVEWPDGSACWVEVKSCTLVEEGVGLFPDAPTERGARHLRELAELQSRGYPAAFCFIVQRPDAGAVRAHRDRDPRFADALRDAAAAGVSVMACTTRVTLEGASVEQVIPVETG